MDARAKIPSKLIDVCPRKKWDWSGPGGGGRLFQSGFLPEQICHSLPKYWLFPKIKSKDLGYFCCSASTKNSQFYSDIFPHWFRFCNNRLNGHYPNQFGLNTFQPILLPTWTFISNTQKIMDTAMFGQYIYCSAVWEKVHHNFEKYYWIFCYNRRDHHSLQGNCLVCSNNCLSC